METRQTPRLFLRLITPSDLDALHQLVTHPNVRRFLCDDQILTQAQVADWINESQALFETKRFGLWGVLLRSRLCSTEDSTEELIGFCGFWYFHTPPELELVFAIAPDYWNQGLATEAAQALIHYGFEHLLLDRIAASADTPNVASVQVMQKLGMKFVRRSVANGSDLVHYSIAREALR